LSKTRTATIDEAQIKALSNPKIKALAEWASKTDKSFVGHFSNRSYGMRKAMGDVGVDENVADLALAALQTPEQMAISAKHKISQLIAQGEGNADPQEIARLQKIISKQSFFIRS
jgi:hypothetical protein